jgi:hypothetical protein
MSDEVPLPRSEDVIKGMVITGSSGSGISRSEKEYKKRFQSLSVEGAIEYAHQKGIEDHYKHKARWSNFLIGAIAAMLIFQSVLLVCVGLGVWDFTKYEWLLPALLVQNLTQVVGLSVWAVKYLFSDISNQK